MSDLGSLRCSFRKSCIILPLEKVKHGRRVVAAAAAAASSRREGPRGGGDRRTAEEESEHGMSCLRSAGG